MTHLLPSYIAVFVLYLSEAIHPVSSSIHWRGVLLMKTSSSERNSRSPWQSSTFFNFPHKARSTWPLSRPDLTYNKMALSWDSWHCDWTNLQYNCHGNDAFPHTIPYKFTFPSSLKPLGFTLLFSMMFLHPILLILFCVWQDAIGICSPAFYFPTLLFCLRLCFCAMP